MKFTKLIVCHYYRNNS